MGLSPLRATKGEKIPHRMVRNNKGILVSIGSKVMQLSQEGIQPKIDHLTKHTLIGKFIGRIDHDLIGNLTMLRIRVG